MLLPAHRQAVHPAPSVHRAQSVQGVDHLLRARPQTAVLRADDRCRAVRPADNAADGSGQADRVRSADHAGVFLAPPHTVCAGVFQDTRVGGVDRPRGQGAVDTLRGGPDADIVAQALRLPDSAGGEVAEESVGTSSSG